MADLTLFDEVKLLHGLQDTLEEAVLDLLPPNHYVFVENDLAGVVHDQEELDCNETVHVVQGQMILTANSRDYVANAGDRILLPKGTVYKRQAGSEGCVYILSQHEEEE